MVVDFSQTLYPEKPVLVLEDLDETPLQTLGYAFGLTGNYCFNEVSTLEFDLPAYVEGVKTPHYDDVVGMRIVDLSGWGRFILSKPKVSQDGVHEIKHCTAYSLEYEWTYKKISVAETVYQFWNPLSPGESVLGIMLEQMPAWSVGYVSSDLLARWRNISAEYKNVYEFAKNDVQVKYGCVFDFDTYQRVVNIYSTNDSVLTDGVFLSTQNLLKNVDLEEDTESIVTALDVNGAEGVDIRMVNPMGINMIYNLDYPISAGMVTASIIPKWQLWKDTFTQKQTEYYVLMLEYRAKISEKLTTTMALTDKREVDLASIEATRSVNVAYLATLDPDPESTEHSEIQDIINQCDADIAAIQLEIAALQTKIDGIQDDLTDVMDRMKLINKQTAFSYVEDGTTHYNFGFTSDDLLVLDRLFKEDSISESSFVLNQTASYSTNGKTKNGLSSLSVVFNTTAQDEQSQDINFGTIREVLGLTDSRLFGVDGGTVQVSGSAAWSGQIISAVVQMTTSAEHTCVVTAYLGHGSLTIDGGTTVFDNGCISATGTWLSESDDLVADSEFPNVYKTGTTLSLSISSASLYFTTDTTEFETYSVEWELYKYGQDALGKLAWPSYSFSLSSANFLAIDDYRSFAQRMTLGHRCYVDLGDKGVLEPILVRAKVAFDDPASLELEFGNTFNLSDSSFALTDLLEKGVSMGKTLDVNKVNYNAFVNSGAANSVKTYMTSALDVAKQTILSGSDMAVSWDRSGFWLRKHNGQGGYDNKQIGMINNSIVFTRDGFATAEMAIGEFYDPSMGTQQWGIVAPSIVGTLIAGQSLWIESSNADNGVLSFRVDSDGASLHNADFSLYDNTAQGDHGRIDLGAEFGIVGGIDGAAPLFTYEQGAISGVATQNNASVTSIAELASGDEPNANFWLDMNGNLWMRGNGTFSGIVKAKDFQTLDGTSIWDANLGKFKDSYLDLSNLGIAVSEPGPDGTVTLSVVLGNQPTSGARGTVAIDGNVNISGTLSAEALYANLGDIADLTVDKLSTSRRISKYIPGNVDTSNSKDLSDDNYIRMQDQSCEWVSGVVTYSNDVPLTEQATNPNGNYLYWESDPSRAGVTYDPITNYPSYGGSRIFTTTVNTGFPVMIYQYEEQIKRSIGFVQDPDSGFYVPLDTFGAGNSLNPALAKGRGYIRKKTDGLHTYYEAESGTITEIHMSEAGYVDIYGMRRTVNLDCTGWPNAGESGTIYETLEGMADDIAYGVSVNAAEDTVTFTYPDGQTFSVSLPTE